MPDTLPRLNLDDARAHYESGMTAARWAVTYGAALIEEVAQLRANLVTAEVTNRSGRSMLFRQCERRRGHGPTGELCMQHARLVAAGRYVSIPTQEDK